MIANDRNPEKLDDFEKPTDIEIAMQLFHLLDDLREFTRFQSPLDGKHIIIKMAENALGAMTNPFAKKLLMDKIIGQQNF